MRWARQGRIRKRGSMDKEYDCLELGNALDESTAPVTGKKGYLC